MSNLGFSDKSSATVRSKPTAESSLKLHGYCKVVCKDKDGNIKWVDEGKNVVTDVGVTFILGNVLATGGATIYIGLIDDSPTVDATDTAANHVGWVEATPYSGNRPAWTRGAASAKAVAGTAVTFTITGTDTVGGAFLDTANTGTGGTLIACRAFTEGDKSVSASDTLDVTYSISADDSGT